MFREGIVPPAFEIMPQIRPIASASRRAGPLTGPLCAAVALLAGLLSDCGKNQDTLAGTSSGVDNPAITVSFRDGATAASVTGTLDVYSSEQNPAVDPVPLATIPIDNQVSTVLRGSDFSREITAATKLGNTGLSKSSAAHSTVTVFNLVLRTHNKTGNLVLGLTFDSAGHAFLGPGGGKLKGVSLQPKPLVRYEARIAREAVHGDAGRVFVPGSPFLGTLVDSLFILEDVPEGMFPMRFIAADGKVYPIADSLNTKDSARVYRPAIVPVGSIDTTGKHDTIPQFEISAGIDRKVLLGQQAVLEAKLIGVQPTDPRLSVLWTWMRDPADSVPHDTLPPIKPGLPPRRAEILTPTALRSEVRFDADGIYRFLVTATVGVRSHSDTVTVQVQRPEPPKPAILHPVPAESLVVLKSYDIQWAMPGKGPYTIEFSPNNGEKWMPIATHYQGRESLQTFPWTVPEAGVSARCLLRVSDEVDTLAHAVMAGNFSIIH